MLGLVSCLNRKHRLTAVTPKGLRLDKTTLESVEFSILSSYLLVADVRLVVTDIFGSKAAIGRGKLWARGGGLVFRSVWYHVLLMTTALA